MQKYAQDLTLRSSGALQVVSGGTIRVRSFPALADVVLYSANDVGSAIGPAGTTITTDADGHFEFYAPDGRYRIDWTASGINPGYLEDILLEDPADAQAAVFSSIVLGAGTVALPSLSFSGDPNTGLYSDGADRVNVSSGGNQIVRYLNTGGNNLTDFFRLTLPALRISIPNAVGANLPSVTFFRGSDGAGVADIGGAPGSESYIRFQSSTPFYWAFSGTAAVVINQITDDGVNKLQVTGPVSFSTTLSVGANPASSGVVRIPNNQGINARNAANSANIGLIQLDASDRVVLSSSGNDILWNRALIALGGGSVPTLGTIGGTGPAAAAQNTWMRVIDSTGAAFFVPAWK